MRQRNARGEGSRLRLEIVQATIRLIDDGTDRLTLRAIAREAGIAGPSIYDHFPDLEGIRTEVIRSCYEDLIERIRQAQDDVADPVERLDVTCFAYTRFGVDFPNRYALLFRGERDQDEKLAVGDRGAAALQTLVDSIAICIEAGRSTSADPYDDALAVWSAIHGLTTLRSSRPHFTRLHRDELTRSVIHRLACITSSPQPLQLDHGDFSVQHLPLTCPSADYERSNCCRLCLWGAQMPPFLCGGGHSPGLPPITLRSPGQMMRPLPFAAGVVLSDDGPADPSRS